jgi:hypothetical protein
VALRADAPRRGPSVAHDAVAVVLDALDSIPPARLPEVRPLRRCQPLFAQP